LQGFVVFATEEYFMEAGMKRKVAVLVILLIGGALYAQSKSQAISYTVVRYARANTGQRVMDNVEKNPWGVVMYNNKDDKDHDIDDDLVTVCGMINQLDWEEGDVYRCTIWKENAQEVTVIYIRMEQVPMARWMRHIWLFWPAGDMANIP
jgi:hypothetical protein